jgi:sucrose-6-phosphate hydrolase SacC (GH32 family)
VRIAGHYLHFPVAAADQDRVKIKLLSNGDVVRYFDIDIAEQGTAPLYWASVEVARWSGQTLQLECENPSILGAVMAVVEQDDTFRRPDNLYNEPRRPQFHFSPAVGWTNDPNGLAYLDGEYHLFFQHNPYGINWGNMTWGHAVSGDLVHWKEIGDALNPDVLGTIFSGSGVVDHNNTSGFQRGSVPPLLVFFTSAGSHSYKKTPYTQSMAYSTDRGRTWTKYAGNPAIRHIQGSNRDPKVFWHEPSGKWVMVLYLDRGKFRLFRSENLKEWEESSDVDFPDGHECPELFELPVDGDASNTRWVMWEAGGRHLIGRFDGQRFTAETEVLSSEWGANCYAAQTWNHVQDGRRLLIGWMRYGPKEGEVSVYQGMPFNQQMTFPRRLSLRTIPQGIRLFAEPASEIEKLYQWQHVLKSDRLLPGKDPLSGIRGELFDIDADLRSGGATSIEFGIRGTPIVYDARSRQLTCLGKSVTLADDNDRLQLRILVDRTSVEIFAAGGRYAMSFCFQPDPAKRALSLRATGGAARIESLHVRELKSIWSGLDH